MKKQLWALALISILLPACSDDKGGDTECKSDVKHQSCALNEGSCDCKCDEGYKDDGKGGCSACAENYVKSEDGESCVPEQVNPDKCANVSCNKGTECNEESGKCECKHYWCEEKSWCVSDESQCVAEACSDESRNACDTSKGCYEFNEGNCTCTSTGNCQISKCQLITVDDLEGNGACSNDDDCRSPEYETCRGGKCVNRNCIGKTWKAGVQMCAISGVISTYEGECCENSDCDTENGETCNLSSHTCAAACSDAPEHNIIYNWSFEDWDEQTPKYWTLYDNAYSQQASIPKSSQAKHCTTGISLINESTKQARLEGDLTQINLDDGYGEQFTASSSNGYNYHYACSLWVKGTGTLAFGYRAYDDDGNELIKETYCVENKQIDSDSFEEISCVGSKDWSIARTVNGKEVTQIMPLIAFRETDAKGLEIDAVTCVADYYREGTSNVCSNVTCDADWKICDINAKAPGTTNQYGFCVPKEGFCDVWEWEVNGVLNQKDTCNNITVTPTNGNSFDDGYSKCDTTTHRCVAKPGACTSHEDCTDNAAPYCNLSTHTCTTGDVCANVKCVDSMECTVDTRGKCVLKEGMCRHSGDCLKDKPLCDPNTHYCVEMDASYSVTSSKECPLGWYYTYLNCEECKTASCSKCSKWADDPQCPINIVPNGDFEVWDDCATEECLSVDGTKYSAPYFWFGNYYGADDGNFDGVAEYYLTNELPVNMTAKYTPGHTGDAGIQIKYPYVYTVKPAKRFVSYGFTVPGDGMYDCSYWVKGKGNVRMAWFGSAGDSAKTMTACSTNYDPKTSFCTYDTNEWVRESFKIKHAQSGVRLVFYVGDTDPDKDHIVIDDVACTRRKF